MREVREFFSGIRKQTGPRVGRLSCPSCGLYKSVLSPKMKPFGRFSKKILVVGEAPGEEEDKKNRQWQGKTGRMLQLAFREHGIDLFGDCLNINAVNCRPVDHVGANRAPTAHEIACCLPFRVNPTLFRYEPKVVLLFGSAALNSVLGPLWGKDLGPISRWRGWTIPERLHRAWICPLFHPSYVQRQESSSKGVGVEIVWKQDLARAFAMVDVPFPEYEDELLLVDIVHDENDAVSLMRRLRKESKHIAIDIEATGLKPYVDLHEIVCLSFCNSANRAWTIRMPQTALGLKVLKLLLEDPKAGKIAQNLKYEDNWFSVLHGISVRPWIWDTMQAAHVLDNRPRVTGLKFQAYVHFGRDDYSSSVEPYLRSVSKKGANAVNRVRELMEDNPDELMKYCGVDSLITFRLAEKQRREMGELD